jgi:imidazole glycerol-phosphate synthase subunit HisH
MIGIINYGIGNIGSIYNIIKRAGGIPIVIENGNELKKLKINKLILPGVGSFGVAMSMLKKGNWIKELEKYISKPENFLLGICLGMQLLFEKSDEGGSDGLGLMKGYVRMFNFPNKMYKIPHMGWNIVKPIRESSLFTLNEKDLRFYHVHSYHVVCDDNSIITAITNYGYDFTSAIQYENILGVQFHPEKSHRFGIALMRKFIEL